MLTPNMHCPTCNVELTLESVREFTAGGFRFYWVCEPCSISVMLTCGIRKETTP